MKHRRRLFVNYIVGENLIYSHNTLSGSIPFASGHLDFELIQLECLHILGFLLELSKILIKRALTIGSQLTIMCRQGCHDTVIFHAWKALKVNEMCVVSSSFGYTIS